jgi:hypothetical protein
VELGEEWEAREGRSEVMSLIELARRPRGDGWTAEQRERIFQRVLARAEEERLKRRRRLAFAAGAGTAMIIGALLWLISIPEPGVARAAPDLARRMAAGRAAAE